MKCPNCGTGIAANARLCSYCGANIEVFDFGVAASYPVVTDVHCVVSVPDYSNNGVLTTDMIAAAGRATREKLMTALAKYVSIERRHDDIRGCTDFVASVRVVPKEYRFGEVKHDG